MRQHIVGTDPLGGAERGLAQDHAHGHHRKLNLRLVDLQAHFFFAEFSQHRIAEDVHQDARQRCVSQETVEVERGREGVIGLPKEFDILAARDGHVRVGEFGQRHDHVRHAFHLAHGLFHLFHVGALQAGNHFVQRRVEFILHFERDIEFFTEPGIRTVRGRGVQVQSHILVDQVEVERHRFTRSLNGEVVQRGRQAHSFEQLDNHVSVNLLDHRDHGVDVDVFHRCYVHHRHIA